MLEVGFPSSFFPETLKASFTLEGQRFPLVFEKEILLTQKVVCRSLMYVP